MKVALYARVSTDKQDEELQLPALRDYAGARGWEIVKEYQDKASAKDANRPAWLALRSDCRRGIIEAVLVTKLDRIMRSVGLLVGELRDFERMGISIISLKEGVLDMSTAGSKLQVQILGSVAEWERETISERTREALRAKQRAGVKLGAPRRELPIHTIALMRLEGKPWAEISRLTHIPRSTIMSRSAEIEKEMMKCKESQ